MVYRSRIPADPEYIQALGQAVYNFAYLEAIVVSTAGRLGTPLPKGLTAGKIANAFDGKTRIRERRNFKALSP